MEHYLQLWIIQLLIMAGIVNEKSLLIIDEPETHLHPKWQVEYAQLLVELAKKDVPVLVTSHSPYFIQAVRKFTESGEMKDRTRFYLSEKEEGAAFSKIDDVTDDLNRVFAKLSKPLQDLVWK